VVDFEEASINGASVNYLIQRVGIGAIDILKLSMKRLHSILKNFTVQS
jgi:hypothetical protein